ncbi:transglycosylase SLT domain-containing protein [Rhodococcus jostii]|uniref:transglycosylase SLT domain-containing protein n=1 Tax=Rhodococcus jostii TaxID=132919 RepID=UPI00362F920B
MADFVAGSASIRISPDLSNFHRKIKTTLRSERIEAPVNVVPDMGQFKQKLETSLGRIRANIKVGVSPDMTGFSTELRTRLAATGGNISIPVDLDFTGARAQLAAFRVEASQAMRANFDLDITAALAQLAALRAAAAGIGSTGSVGGGLGSIGSSAAGMINPIQMATTALLALAAVNVVPLVGQLAQAAGVISLLPAAAAAAAAGIATIVIGSTGVMDAFKAGSKAADDAAKNGAKAAKEAAANGKAQASAQKAVASAARGVEDAEDGVARAERGVQQAQKQSVKAQQDLTRARKNAQEQIEDLNLSLKGSAIDERSAVAAVKRAEQQLRELGKDGEPVTALDLEEAVIGVDEAKQRLDEVRERNGDLREETEAANKAGIEGSEQVVAAKEKVADADQGVVDAQLAVLDSQQSLLDAQQNLTEAQVAATEATSASTDAIDEYADALANLSPNARQFVEDTRALGSAWNDLRLQVQDNLFSNLGTTLTDFANVALPTLKGGLSGIATEINLGVRRAIADLSTESTKLDWTKILENTRLAIGPLIDGLSNLWGSLTNIAAIGSEFLPGFGKSFSDVMAEFRAWTESPDGQNKIRDFMSNSIRALGEIKDLFVEIGRVVGGLFSTSDESGKSMVQSLTETMREFADWMRTAEGQQQMKKFWEDVRTTVTDILNLVKTATLLADKIQRIMDSTNPFDGGGGANGSNASTIGKALGVPGLGPLTGGAFDLGMNNLKRAWGWGAGIFGGGDAPSGPASAGNMGMTPEDTLQRLNIPAGGGRSAGTKVTRDEWIALFGNAEEFDRILAEQTSKQNQNLRDSESSYRDFAANVTSILDGLTGGGFTNFTNALDGLGKKIFGTTEDGKTNWGNMGTRFGEVVTNLVDTVFPGFQNGLQKAKDFAGAVVEGFNGDWSRLKGYAMEPINWIIEHVVNGALKNAWNAVASVIPGLKTWEGMAPIDIGQTNDGSGQGGGFNKPLAGYYTGGIIPGYTPGKDTTVIGVGGGEAVMRPEWTRAMGADYVNAMNAAARQGGVDGVKQRMQYFNQGGIVESMTSAVQEKFPGMQMTSGLRFTDNGYHSKGMAADFSDGTASTPAMRQLAGWIADNFANRTIELIHDPFDRNIGAGNPVGDGYGFYGAGTMAEHNNHVHWAADGLLGGGGAVGSADGGGILGSARRVLGSAVNSARSAAASAFESAASALGSNIPDFGPSMMGQLPRAAFDGIKDAMTSAIRGVNSSSSGSVDAGTTPFDLGAGVEQWRSKVIEALKREGFDPSERNQQLMLAQIQSESGGNPNIVQSVQDVNSGGNEAVGLLQVIPGTFATHRNPDLPNDRTNPDASMSAALRYYRSRYGDDLGAMWGQGHGYANGGIIPGYTPGTDTYKIAVGGGEAVMRPEWTRGVGKPYVDNMNYIARTQGIDGVRKAARFAVGGVVDPNEFLLDRLGKFGSQVGDIAKSAIPEILGVQGTVLDPNHRYWQAAMDIQSAVQSSQATAPGSTVQNIPAPLNGGPQPAPMPAGNTFVYNVSDFDEAMRKTQTVLKQQALTFTRR